MTRTAVYVGLDLGAFKTSAAASNGAREVTYTAVGWPKDHVARAALGREVVFGPDVLRRRLALDVVRPFAAGALKYQDPEAAGLSGEQTERRRRAAGLLVRHVVSALHLPAGAPVYGVIGAPSRADDRAKRVLLDAAAEAFDAAVIVPEPFAVAYGLGQLTDTLVVDIGAGTIDVCPMYGAYPAEQDQVTRLFGGDAVDEKLCELIRQAHPDVRLTRNMAREIKEKHGAAELGQDAVSATLPVKGRPAPVDVTGPLREACVLLVRQAAEAVREAVERCDPEQQATLLQNILLSGGGGQLKGLDQALERELAPYGEASVTRVYDSVYAGAAGALKLAMSLPPDQWRRFQAESPPSAPPAKAA